MLNRLRLYLEKIFSPLLLAGTMSFMLSGNASSIYFTWFYGLLGAALLLVDITTTSAQIKELK